MTSPPTPIQAAEQAVGEDIEAHEQKGEQLLHELQAVIQGVEDHRSKAKDLEKRATALRERADKVRQSLIAAQSLLEGVEGAQEANGVGEFVDTEHAAKVREARKEGAGA